MKDVTEVQALGGGWSDTPPITNESGGDVCNVAITLEKEIHCLGCRARRVSLPNEDRIKFVLHSKGDPSSPVICSTQSDLDDHFNPKSPGALLKCVLLSLMSSEELFLLPKKQYEIQTWSDLPAGSGLGGSSILAACAVLSLGRLFGFCLSRMDIINAVLKVEQLLSTGGGWQDQIGAIYPRFKITRSPARLPVEVHVDPLPCSNEFLEEFEARVVLIQTGPARLARDLLQNVVRRWHRREEEFTVAIEQLRQNAERMSLAITSENFLAIGRELNEYWKLKKFVTGQDQAEPQLVKDLFKETSTLTDSQCLCGAGGGGFAVLILKTDTNFESLHSIVTKKFPYMQVHHVYVCSKGLSSFREDLLEEQYQFAD